MDEATFLGAVRPLVVRHRGSWRNFSAALTRVAVAEAISVDPTREPGAAMHDVNAQMKELFGPVAERDEATHLRVVGNLIVACTKLSENLTDANICAIIDRVLGEPLTPHEQRILEDSE